MIKKFFGVAVLTVVSSGVASALQLDSSFWDRNKDKDKDKDQDPPKKEKVEVELASPPRQPSSSKYDDNYVSPHDYTRGMYKYRETAEVMEQLMNKIDERIDGKSTMEELQEYARIGFASEFEYDFAMCVGEKIDSENCKQKAKQVASKVTNNKFKQPKDIPLETYKELTQAVHDTIRQMKGCGPKQSQLYLMLSFVATKIKMPTASDWPLKSDSLVKAKEMDEARETKNAVDVEIKKLQEQKEKLQKENSEEEKEVLASEVKAVFEKAAEKRAAKKILEKAAQKNK